MKLLLNPKTLTFTFEVPYMEKSEGVQKILGMAIGLKHHRVDYFPYFHRSNSILLGASAAKDNGPVKLWNYSYVDGRHVQKEMISVAPKTILKAELRWGVNTDIIIYNETGQDDYSTVSIKRPKSSCIGMLLHPYFETDSPENKVIPFNVRIWDIKVNGKLIEI
jgi:hypothetical protein